MIDHTHDASARSWVASAEGHRDFPIQNLAMGVFTPAGGAARCGAAIGEEIVDLTALAGAGQLPADSAAALQGSTLNAWLGLPSPARRGLRHRLFQLLAAGATERASVEVHLHRAADCELGLPVRVGGYTDFYAGIVHATNVGRLMRPDNPLMPNYKYVPIGYNGRASSVCVSGVAVRRPSGQLKGPDEAEPRFAPCRRLDYECELGLWVGEANALGQPVPIAQAGERIAGVSLLNDWSARDVQAWEYQPLGPFLAKTFATSVSPWIVTAEALAPYRIAQPPRPPGDPAPLPYLLDPADQAAGALDIAIEVTIRTERMRAQGRDAVRLGRTHTAHLYWTPAQLLAHHASNGCNLEPGDLLGTGTISAPDREGFGSLMEITAGGREPFPLPHGEDRRFLEDGDEVIMTGRCTRDGFAPIGLGQCRAVVLPAL